MKNNNDTISFLDEKFISLETFPFRSFKCRVRFWNESDSYIVHLQRILISDRFWQLGLATRKASLAALLIWHLRFILPQRLLMEACKPIVNGWWPYSAYENVHELVRGWAKGQNAQRLGSLNGLIKAKHHWLIELLGNSIDSWISKCVQLFLVMHHGLLVPFYMITFTTSCRDIIMEMKDWKKN